MTYDLWEFIGLSDRETLLSGIIGWLLNPKGDHNLGDSVLNKFLKLAGIENSLFTDNSNVQVEQKSKSGRRFDIFIKDQNNNKVAIEVKCKTDGTLKQLKNYSESVPTIIRIGFGEWNFPDMGEFDRNNYPLITFKEIAGILENVGKKSNKYNDLISSCIEHLNRESNIFDHIYEYYITENRSLALNNYNREKGKRFYNRLYWRWILTKMIKNDPDIKNNWKIKSQSSGDCFAGADRKVGDNEILNLNSFNLELKGPFKVWIHFEIKNKASLFGPENNNVGEVQLRIDNSKYLKLLHEEFKKSKEVLNKKGYELPKQKPKKGSNYYRAITKPLTKNELKYSSLVNILRNDFKEIALIN